jgi:hypothetical protein
MFKLLCCLKEEEENKESFNRINNKSLEALRHLINEHHRIKEDDTIEIYFTEKYLRQKAIVNLRKITLPDFLRIVKEFSEVYFYVPSTFYEMEELKLKNVKEFNIPS